MLTGTRMCLNMCVWVYSCTHVCVYAYAYAHMYVRIHVAVHIHSSVFMHTCADALIHIHIHMLRRLYPAATNKRVSHGESARQRRKASPEAVALAISLGWGKLPSPKKQGDRRGGEGCSKKCLQKHVVPAAASSILHISVRLQTMLRRLYPAAISKRVSRASDERRRPTRWPSRFPAGGTDSHPLFTLCLGAGDPLVDRRATMFGKRRPRYIYLVWQASATSFVVTDAHIPCPNRKRAKQHVTSATRAKTVHAEPYLRHSVAPPAPDSFPNRVNPVRFVRRPKLCPVAATLGTDYQGLGASVASSHPLRFSCWSPWSGRADNGGVLATVARPRQRAVDGLEPGLHRTNRDVLHRRPRRTR